MGMTKESFFCSKRIAGFSKTIQINRFMFKMKNAKQFCHCEADRVSRGNLSVAGLAFVSYDGETL